MGISYIYYLATGLLLILLGRIWHNNEIEKLTDDQKIKVSEVYRKRTKLTFYLHAAIFVVFFAIIFLDLASIKPIFFWFLVLNTLSLTIPLNIIYNKLLKLNLPVSFTNNFIFTSGLNILGGIVLLSYFLS
jgi:hypothetical protein